MEHGSIPIVSPLFHIVIGVIGTNLAISFTGAPPYLMAVFYHNHDQPTFSAISDRAGCGFLEEHLQVVSGSSWAPCFFFHLPYGYD